MNKIGYTLALAFALPVLASTANAAGNNSSFMQCGIKFAGAEVAQSSQSEGKNQQRKKVTYRTGLLGSDASGVSEFSRAKSKREDRRLPPTFTVAQFGCSW